MSFDDINLTPSLIVTMKKMMLGLALTSVLTSFGCSEDDEQTCRTCEVLSIPNELCDNGNGTLTFTAPGQTSTVSGEDLQGMTPAEFIESFCGPSDFSV